MKKKMIAVKGVAKLEKKELANTKGAGCGVIFGDGQIIYCSTSFHMQIAVENVAEISHHFYY